MQASSASAYNSNALQGQCGAKILSVVSVISEEGPQMLAELLELHQQLGKIDTPTELVVVLNGCNKCVVEACRALGEIHGRLQAYVLNRHVDYATALLAGLENCVGDWIVIIEVGCDEPSIVQRLLDCAMTQGSEVVLGLSNIAKRSVRQTIFSKLFHCAFKCVHGFSLSQEIHSARLFSRTVLNAILRHDCPQVALDTLPAKGGYRRATITSRPRNLAQQSIGETVHSRWRTLIGINALPLRLANLLCGISALSACLYSIFVVSVFILKKDVVPGWTTVSLMLSLMFFMVALVLLLLSEYMLMLLDPGMRHPKYEIAEEFGAGATLLRNKLNVETRL